MQILVPTNLPFCQMPYTYVWVVTGVTNALSVEAKHTQWTLKRSIKAKRSDLYAMPYRCD